MTTASTRNEIVRMESLEGRLYLAAVEPTANDQYMLELINWARANPALAASGNGIDLNEGLAAGTITTDAKQPLAFNLNLVDAARNHTQWMLSNNKLQTVETPENHYTPAQRMANAGYVNATAADVAENLAAYIFAQGASVDVRFGCQQIMQALLIDSNSAGRTDRLNLLDNRFHEIGVGTLAGVFNGSNAVLATQDFAFQAGNPFLTGVVYDDTTVLADNFYTPGEGLANVTVTAVKHGGGTFTTNTYGSGGYSLQLAAGTYDVTFSGTGLASSYIISNVVVAGDNVKLDFRRDKPPAQADLTVPPVKGAALKLYAFPGQSLDFSAVVRNIGTANIAKTFTNTLYISNDSTVTAADTDAADYTVSSLKARATDSRTISFTAPVQDGTYYLALMADSGGDVAETAKGNNWGSVYTLVVGEPDVALTASACSLSSVIVPGDKGTLTVQLANAGTIPASGAATFHVYASADDTVGQGDVELYSVVKNINLAPNGGHMSLSLPFTVTDAVAAGDWNFIAKVDPLPGETVTNNNSDVAPGTRQLVWQFGSFSGRKNVTLQVHDANGTPVSFSLAGDGWGEVAGGSDLTTITANQTSTRSSLTIKTAAKAAHALVGSLDVLGSIKSISAAAADFTGAVAIDGGVSTLTLGNIAGGAIELHQNNALLVDPKLQTALAVGVASDTVLDAGDIPLKSLTATSWTNADPTDLLRAPSLGGLTVKGVTGKNAIPGNFAATLDVGGTIGPVSIAGDLSGETDATSIQSLRVGGDMDAMVLKLSQVPDVKLSALGSLTVTGWINNSQVLSDGNIGPVSAGGLDNSKIYAGVAVAGLPSQAADIPLHATIKSVAVTGKVDLNHYSVINTNIAAWTLSSVSLVDALALNNPSSPWGIAYNSLGKYSYRDAFTRYTWPNKNGDAKPTHPSDDFTVNVIS